MSTLGNQFTVAVPEQVGPFTIQYTRYGRAFATFEAAKRTAQRLHGRVHPYGSNAVLVDFGDELELEPMPDTRQRRGAALAAYLGLQS